MTSREKVLESLNHQSGPVPMDFGSSAVTGIHCSCVAAVRDHYGLEKRPVKIHEPCQILGLVEDDLLDALGVDTVGTDAISTFFGFPPDEWKPWTAAWGQAVLVPGKFNITQNKKGTYLYPEGDASIGPSAHMPTASFFFDTIVRRPEIDNPHFPALRTGPMVLSGSSCKKQNPSII